MFSELWRGTVAPRNNELKKMFVIAESSLKRRPFYIRDSRGVPKMNNEIYTTQNGGEQLHLNKPKFP